LLFVVEAGRYGMDDAKVLAGAEAAGDLVANKLGGSSAARNSPPGSRACRTGTVREFVPLAATRADDVNNSASMRPTCPEQAWWYDEEH
jgi:GTP-binding protein Era